MKKTLFNFIGGAALLLAGAHPGRAQVTYTYDGSSWSDGTSTVAAPLLAAGNSVVIQSGNLTCGVLEVRDATTSTAGVAYTANFAQSFKPMNGGSISAVTLYKLGTGNAGLSFVLKLYAGVPGSGTLKHSESFVTVSEEEQRVTLSAPLQVTGQSNYYLVVEDQSGVSPAAFRWRRTSSNLYADGALHLNSGATSQDLWFRLRFDHSLGNLTVAQGATLTMDFCDLNVLGNLQVEGGLVLNAELGDYSQLKVSGSVGGSGTVTQKQFLSGAGYHALASSMSSGMTVTSGTASALFAYDAATGAYYTGPSLTAVGQGYFGKLGANGFLASEGVFSVTGTPNTSATFTLGYAANVAAGGSGSGWNLIGNPYTCGLDWNTVAKTHVNNAIYVWDPASTSYRYYVNGIAPPPSAGPGMSLSQGVVAPLQAFWVQTTQAGASVSTTMAAHGTTATTPRFYKQAPVNLRLRVSQVGRDERRDCAWLIANAEATPGFEGAFDAWKLSNTGGMPNVALVHEGERFAVNALDLSRPQQLGVDLRGEAGAKFTLALDADSATAGFRVGIEDHLTQTWVDLGAGPLTVEHAGWTSESPRFTLWVQPVAYLGGDAPEAASWAMWSRGELRAVSPEPLEGVRVLALDGRVLEAWSAQGERSLRRSLNVPAGAYLVELRSSAGREVHRITVMP